MLGHDPEGSYRFSPTEGFVRPEIMSCNKSGDESPIAFFTAVM